ncbi:MAG: MarR family transcriptional regulator [Bacteroidetes bacterium]|nr:MarR family transcriptional regulator [Bacteroidota bacterium]
MSSRNLDANRDAAPSESDAGSTRSQALSAAGRALSTAEILFHRAVAESVGLSPGDHKYLDVLIQNGPMSAGQLAERTGLTTGAVTGIIDRLEKAGLVRRARDPEDRRKVIIELREDEAGKRIGPAFAGLGEAMETLNADYTDEELGIILDYMTRCADILREQTQRLRDRTSDQ